MKRLILSLIIPIFLFPLIATAESPEEKGLAIAREADRRDTGWGDSQSNLTMILKNRHGDESKRIIRGKSLEVPGDGDKSLSIFDTLENLMIDDRNDVFFSLYKHNSGTIHSDKTDIKSNPFVNNAAMLDFLASSFNIFVQLWFFFLFCF